MAHMSALAKFVSLIVFLVVLYLFVVLMNFILPSQRILNDAGEIVQTDLWLWSTYATLAILAFLLVLGLITTPLASLGIKDAKEALYGRARASLAPRSGAACSRVPGYARV